MQKQYACMGCNAEFKIKHNLESEYYEVQYCPFCGDSLNFEEEDEDEDDTY